MTERFDRDLDDDPDAAALSAADRERLKQAVDETGAFIDAGQPPDFTASVMQAIEQQRLRPLTAPRGARLRRAAAMIWTARDISFRFRPAYALLGAVAIALLVAYEPPGGTPLADSRPAAVVEPQLFVQFRFQAPGASDVRLAGSFTGWEPRHQMHQTAPGAWTITLPLPRGVHDYAFIVDGTQWVADPYAQQVNDGFGGTNSRIALLPPDPPQT